MGDHDAIDHTGLTGVGTGDANAHIADTSAAHAASAVSVDSTSLSGTATDVQGSLEELDNLLDAHASRHVSGGADSIKLDDLATPDDNTDLNASTSRHGLLKKLSNVATEYMDGTGAWSTPAGGGGGGASDPIADLFGAPATAYEFDTTSTTGLTALGSLDAESFHTQIAGHLFMQDNDGSFAGRYHSASAPFTAIAKLSSAYINSNYQRAHLFIGEAAPAAILTIGPCHDNGYAFQARKWTALNGSTSTPTHVFVPVYYPVSEYYLAAVVNSTTDVDLYVSQNGRVWFRVVDAYNPSMTIGSVGLVVTTFGGGPTTRAAWDFLRIWTSALTFPEFV